MPEPGDHLRCACVQAGDEGVNHLHCEPSPDHADDPENREGALMARRNLKRARRSRQVSRTHRRVFGTVHGLANPMYRHENLGGQGRVVPRTFILPSLNGKISRDFRRSLSVAHYHRMTPLLRSITISLARTRYMADPASSNGRCVKSMQRTRSLPVQMRVILAFSWCAIERSLPSDQLDFCHEQTPIGA